MRTFPIETAEDPAAALATYGAVPVAFTARAVFFRAAARWAAGRGARRLAVETQNVNVAACRFYARRGCALGAVRRFAHPDAPHGAQLLRYPDRGGTADATAAAAPQAAGPR